MGAPIAPRSFLPLLGLSAVAGIVASLAAWCFLEATYWTQQGLFDGLPDVLGYESAPLWWPLPVLCVAALAVAWSITRLPGTGGHPPAHGLSTGASVPRELPGVLAAATATIGGGLVLGPEAPLIALGGALGLILYKLAASDAPPDVGRVLAASATFAALSLIFDSPLIAAVVLIEATGLGGSRLPVVLLPGLLAAGIGSLVSIGMGSFTGLSSRDYAIPLLSLPDFARPDIVDFAWTLVLAAVIAAGCVLVVRAARSLEPAMTRRPFVLLPAAGLAVGGLAIAFAALTDKGFEQVLFSGQEALPGLAEGAAAWSAGALALLLLCKGIAWAVCLAGFRGGPTFPAMFLGAAAGVLASHLPGVELTPAVAVGLGAGVVAMLRLPLSAVVLATLLTSQAGIGSSPLIIVGVVTAYLVAEALDPKPAPDASAPPPAAVPPVPRVPEATPA